MDLTYQAQIGPISSIGAKKNRRPKRKLKNDMTSNIIEEIIS
jgi:hypothetical protein